MQITKLSARSCNAIINLLQSNGLPVQDLPPTLTHFYTAVEEGKVIGLIGMERYGHYGLLRSMVVHPDYRNKHIAENLVKWLEEEAVSSGISALYLLTETADKYFSKKGYHTITRNEVPDKVKSSSGFSHVCPVSAVVMKKELSAQPATAL